MFWCSKIKTSFISAEPPADVWAPVYLHFLNLSSETQATWRIGSRVQLLCQQCGLPWDYKYSSMCPQTEEAHYNIRETWKGYLPYCIFEPIPSLSLVLVLQLDWSGGLFNQITHSDSKEHILHPGLLLFFFFPPLTIHIFKPFTVSSYFCFNSSIKPVIIFPACFYRPSSM